MMDHSIGSIGRQALNSAWNQAEMEAQAMRMKSATPAGMIAPAGLIARTTAEVDELAEIAIRIAGTLGSAEERLIGPVPMNCQDAEAKEPFTQVEKLNAAVLRLRRWLATCEAHATNLTTNL